MYGFLLQDWITIRGTGTSGLVVVQSEANWVSLQPYQDIVFWLEVRECTLVPTGGTSVILDYETAPMKDENLFRPMVTGSTLTAASASTTPTITKVLLQQNPTVPLARWVRWKLTANGTAGAWDLTFRLSAAANAVGALG